MKKLIAEDPEPRSADLVAGGVERLRAAFPEAFSEGRIDFEALRQLLGDAVEEREERYGLGWHGKRSARRAALTPSTCTLRPRPDESVEWATTRNVMIEGDNLEVLKLLQRSYAGKVDLIYIDPPYNTGKDHVYPDDFQDTLADYLALTGQAEGGQAARGDAEAGGRLHTDWLNMMYPRLKLARTLLADDGLILISIDDNELHTLRAMCDELFGEENFVECYVWESTFRPDNSSRLVRKNAEFILCFARELASVQRLTGEVIERTGLPSLTKASMPRSTLELPARSVTFAIPDGRYAPGQRGSYELLDEVDVGGGTNAAAFRLTGRVTWGQAKLLAELARGTRIVIKTEGFVPYVDKGARGELRPSKLIPHEQVGDVLAARAELRALFAADVFSYPKPVSLLRYLLRMRSTHDLVLDFFAGSGTTGQAVMDQNAADGGTRRFLLVQLPEALDPARKEQRRAADLCDALRRPRSIAELTKERLRRAARRIKDADPTVAGDLGFRVFRLDSSAISAREPGRADRPGPPPALGAPGEDGPSEADLLHELLLTRGLDLCAPIEHRTIAGKAVQSVGGGALFACLAREITPADVEPLAQGILEWRAALAPRGESTCAFRDGAFPDDAARTDLGAILERRGSAGVRVVSV